MVDVRSNPQADQVAVSVVFPVKTWDNLAWRQFFALLAQDTRHSHEIIVVGDKKTLSYVKSWQPLIVCVEVPPACGESHARNQGIYSALGRYVLGCDPDDAVCAGWLDNMVAALEDGCDVVGGPLDETSYNDETTQTMRPPLVGDDLPLVFGVYPRPVTANYGIRRSVFLEAGGFDESWSWSSDTEFFTRLHRLGYRIGYAPQAMVKYNHGSIRDSLRKLFWWQFTRPRLWRMYGVSGAQRDPWWRATGGAVRLLLLSYRVFTSRRLEWLSLLVEKTGRIAGSIRYKSFYV